jgi:hypothetical protein
LPLLTSDTLSLDDLGAHFGCSSFYPFCCLSSIVRQRRGVADRSAVTGNAAASDQKKSTNVTIEDEKLTIDLHQEFAFPL